MFVTVIRNLHTPLFSSAPCHRQLSQNIAVGTSVTQVVATDDDSNVSFGITEINTLFVLFVVQNILVFRNDISLFLLHFIYSCIYSILKHGGNFIESCN